MTKHRLKVGRPKKKPGEAVDHRLTPKVRTAIVAMVEDGKTVEESAEAAGLTPSAIYKAMRNPPAREFYTAELRQLLHCAKAQAAHALIRGWASAFESLTASSAVVAGGIVTRNA